jgi:uncharacterized protein YcgL (UPF0745 family)
MDKKRKEGELDTGLYVYAIKEKGDAPLPLSLRGIDQKGQVFTYHYREIEAVVSRVSIQEYTSEEIQKKSKEDINWIKEKALLHEKVIEEAMKDNDKTLSIIPMTFGIIFKNKRNLQSMLEKRYLYFKKNLKELKGKREWSIKVYLENRKKIEQIVKEKDKEVKAKEEEIKTLPEGMAFFMEEELKETIAKGIKREIDNNTDILFKQLTEYTFSIKEGKLLDKELTGKKEPMVINVLLLIKDKDTDLFRKEVAEITKIWEKNGFYLECNGPFPVYNFLSEEENER